MIRFKKEVRRARKGKCKDHGAKNGTAGNPGEEKLHQKFERRDRGPRLPANIYGWRETQRIKERGKTSAISIPRKGGIIPEALKRSKGRIRERGEE